jgi:hypothetical protein
MNAEGRFSRNWLKGALDDTINAVLRGAAASWHDPDEAAASLRPDSAIVAENWAMPGSSVFPLSDKLNCSRLATLLS